MKFSAAMFVVLVLCVFFAGCGSTKFTGDWSRGAQPSLRIDSKGTFVIDVNTCPDSVSRYAGTWTSSGDHLILQIDKSNPGAKGSAFEGNAEGTVKYRVELVLVDNKTLKVEKSQLAGMKEDSTLTFQKRG